MELNRTEMIKALALMLPGLAKKAAVQQSNSFVFLNGRIITFNGEVCISVKADWGFEGALQADPLYKLLNRLTGDTVKVEMDENQLRIACGRSRSGLKIDADIKLPIKEIVMPLDDAVRIDLPEGFIEAAKMCLFSAGKDKTKPILTCVSMEGDFLQSCNNYQLTRITVPGLDIKNSDPEVASVNIPAKVMKALVAYAPNELIITEAWAHFLTEGETTFSCRLVEGEYPFTMDILTQVGPELRMPKGLVGILKRAEVFTEKEFNADENVEIRVVDGRMTVKGEGSAGWFEEAARVKCKEACYFNINPEFLEKILSISAAATVGDVAVTFKAENFVHAIILKAMGDGEYRRFRWGS